MTELQRYSWPSLKGLPGKQLNTATRPVVVYQTWQLGSNSSCLSLSTWLKIGPKRHFRAHLYLAVWSTPEFLRWSALFRWLKTDHCGATMVWLAFIQTHVIQKQYNYRIIIFLLDEEKYWTKAYSNKAALVAFWQFWIIYTRQCNVREDQIKVNVNLSTFSAKSETARLS